MYRAFLTIVCFAAAAAFSSAPQMPVAAAAAPTPVPMTRPDFSPMKFLLGTWTCTEMLRGRNRPDTSTTTIGLDGAYMISHDVAPPFDKYRNKTVITDTYTTYNPQTHQWVSFNMDNFGGYLVTTSPGWSGNTMTSKSVMSQDGSTGSATMTKISDTETQNLFITKSPNGTMTREHATCKKK